MAFEEILGQAPPSPWQYAAQHSIPESEVPHEVFQAWRNWTGGERRLANNFIDQGYNPEELGIYNVKEHGQSLWRELQGESGTGVADRHKEAFQRSVSEGHFTQDPTTGLFYNIGRADPFNPNSWEYKDESGNLVNVRRRDLGHLRSVGEKWAKESGYGKTPARRPGSFADLQVPQGPTDIDKSAWLQGDPGDAGDGGGMEGVMTGMFRDGAFGGGMDSPGRSMVAGNLGGGDIAGPSRRSSSPKSYLPEPASGPSIFGGGVQGLLTGRRARRSTSLFG